MVEPPMVEPMSHPRSTDIGLGRRRFLGQAGGAVAGLVAAPALVGCVGPGRSWPEGDPFSLGVAAGSPSPDGFVLWTRLAPVPLAPDPATPGGMTGPAVPVAYEIAADSALRQIVRRGVATAEPAFAYAVHVEVAGLAPGRPYWYRFTSGDAASRIGRAMTLPAPGPGPERLRLAVASCANYEQGYFAAYRHMADEAPDLAVFLGDYIYEYVNRRPGATVRRHSDGVEAATLPTYRNRYAQYRLDPDLQRLHAEVPALVTWDDHEVQNDYADQWSQTFDDPKQFLLRRAAAYQAYYEHMPLRPSWSRPAGPAMRVYDRFAFGQLAEITMLDGRQYRSPQACYRKPDRGGGHLENDATCPERRDPARTLLGRAQEHWLYDGLAQSRARWNVIAQDVMMAQLIQKSADGGLGQWTDSVGRLSGELRPAAEPSARCARRQSSGAERRHPFLLDQRPDAQFRRPALAPGRDRIHHHLDHGVPAALRRLRRAAAVQPACPVLREPPARLHHGRDRHRAADRALPRHLRRQGSQCDGLDSQKLRHRERPAGRAAGLGCVRCRGL